MSGYPQPTSAYPVAPNPMSLLMSLLIQVEVIMVEISADGVAKGRYSIGWSLLPLFKPPGSPATANKPAAAPLVAGSPRYLMFRSVYGESVRPPKVVEGCHILFQVSTPLTMNVCMPAGCTTKQGVALCPHCTMYSGAMNPRHLTTH